MHGAPGRERPLWRVRSTAVGHGDRRPHVERGRLAGTCACLWAWEGDICGLRAVLSGSVVWSAQVGRSEEEEGPARVQISSWGDHFKVLPGGSPSFPQGSFAAPLLVVERLCLATSGNII